MIPSPRTFTRAELTETISTAQYLAMPPADRLAFDQALVNLWVANTAAQSLADFEADFKRIGSRESHEWGA